MYCNCGREEIKNPFLYQIVDGEKMLMDEPSRLCPYCDNEKIALWNIIQATGDEVG